MFSAFIVDDDKHAAIATQLMFDWDSLNISQIIKIHSANSLSKKILTEKPHVVFMDIEIGDVSGLDIIHECKENGSEALFIIVSGHDNFDYARAAVNIGAIHYLLKPIGYSDVDLVSKKIKKFLPTKHSANECENVFTLPIKPDDDWLKIQKYISENYEKKLYASDICRETLINRTNFFELFKANTGKTFTEYLASYRMEKAKLLLVTSTKLIEDIAVEVGVPDVYYFNKIFKSHYGVSPKTYRMQSQRGEQ